ncbi:hypothetical protein DENIS_1679 [Desulfonema ishimotonii]|uniref:Cardiolipin synthase N-terminal domain-containing protein n=1 Tax=Desulfonema ishimotonii TaxID=45657 RepID=A0A401FUT7_9BACT|nr:PLDc N-terminal domain-containing protein [Desulfonema ishimotonii]GBC60720.1 hypothetical protein DENIS_1679 [Desulfonema ishimotonii]
MDMHTITVMAVIGLVFLLVTWMAVIDIATKEFSSQGVRIGWGITVALVPFIGCLLYFLFGFRKGVRKEKNAGI